MPGAGDKRSKTDRALKGRRGGMCALLKGDEEEKGGGGKMAVRGVGDACPSDAEVFFSLHRGWKLFGRVSSKS